MPGISFYLHQPKNLEYNNLVLTSWEGEELMFSYFQVLFSNGNITMSKKIKNISVTNISIILDNQFIGSMIFSEPFIIHGYKPKTVLIWANILYNGHVYTIHEMHRRTEKKRKLPRHSNNENVDYRSGDILVACDNLNGLPFGYMGHSAIAVDDKMAVEAMIYQPIVRKIPIESFIKDHPNHAHFRPFSKEAGEKAADYALNYLKKFEENMKAGIGKPVFKFTLSTPLTDEWTYIYCSKLVWLAYYYGSNYEFINDHLWFAPEDLYSNLDKNPLFELVYIHPDFVFHLDL